jgi:hypothetical protein
MVLSSSVKRLLDIQSFRALLPKEDQLSTLNCTSSTEHRLNGPLD